jgi:hypothetical protein
MMNAPVAAALQQSQVITRAKVVRASGIRTPAQN